MNVETSKGQMGSACSYLSCGCLDHGAFALTLGIEVNVGSFIFFALRVEIEQLITVARALSLFPERISTRDSYFDDVGDKVG